jgi:hypothetical protein
MLKHLLLKQMLLINFLKEHLKNSMMIFPSSAAFILNLNLKYIN